MEHKKDRSHLRLVKTHEDAATEDKKKQKEEMPPQHSAFARQMNAFADELDRMIENIMQT